MERLLIFTTRIRAKNRRIVINKRRGIFFTVYKYVRERVEVGFKLRVLGVGRDRRRTLIVSIIDDVKISSGRLMIVG